MKLPAPLFRWTSLGLLLLFAGLGRPAWGENGATRPALAGSAESLETLVPDSVADLERLQHAIRTVYLQAAPATVAIQAGGAHGCGVIFNPEGYVLTAAHVAGRPGRQVDVLLADGRRVRGRSLGVNHRVDGGMVRLEGPGPWPYVAAGTSQGLQVGQWCIALGYPGGYDPDSSHPPVLRFGRLLAIGDNGGALLTDCTLIGGDSGGPLLSLDGQIIGIHSRIGADLTANLHVPVDEFRQNGRRYQSGESWGLSGYLGVRGQTALGDPAAEVTAVLPSSPALLGGIRPGDRVLRVGQQPVRSFDDLKRYVQQAAPGDEVQMLVRRDNDTLPLTVRLGQSPQPPHSEDDAKLLQRFLLHVVTGTSRLRTLPDMSVLHVGKNHELIKEAARPAAERVKFSVARLVADGRSVGLATVVDQRGYLVGKASEIAGARRVECRFYGGRHLEAREVATSTEDDLVLLQVEADDLVPVQWADAAEPAVGTWVASVATGDQLLAMGNISCAPRSVEREDGFLGVQLEGVDDQVLVQHVLNRSAADAAGVRDGDRILSVDGAPVTSIDTFIEQIRGYWPGDEITLVVQRGSQRLELSALLTRQSDMEAEQSGFGDFLGSELSTRRSGFPLVLQHDTVVLPEYCGGPIVNLQGECLGINIARAERVSSYALPVQVVRPWVESILTSQGESPLITTARPAGPAPAAVGGR